MNESEINQLALPLARMNLEEMHPLNESEVCRRANDYFIFHDGKLHYLSDHAYTYRWLSAKGIDFDGQRLEEISFRELTKEDFLKY